MKIGLLIVLLLTAAHLAPSAQTELTVTAVNKLKLARPSETIELTLKNLAPLADAGLPTSGPGKMRNSPKRFGIVAPSAMPSDSLRRSPPAMLTMDGDTLHVTRVTAPSGDREAGHAPLCEHHSGAVTRCRDPDIGEARGVIAPRRAERILIHFGSARVMPCAEGPRVVTDRSGQLSDPTARGAVET